MNFNSSRCLFALLAASLLASLSGCIWGSVQYDRTINEETILAIQPGTTTRDQIFHWFGPPTLLALQGETVRRPSSDPNHPEIQKISSHHFLKYFSYSQTATKDHAVYYYFNQERSLIGFIVPVLRLYSFAVTWGDYHHMELFVLMNRRTGLVEDYLYLEREDENP